MKFLFVLSRDPDEYRGVREFATTNAEALAKSNEVHFYLIENGVFAAKKGKPEPMNVVKPLTKNGVKVYAEDVSLKVRGLVGKTEDGVKVSNMDELVDLLMEKTDRVIWY